MKATITTDGTLVLTPESSIEGYALSYWMSDRSAVIYAKPWAELPAPFDAGAKTKIMNTQE